MVATLLLTFFHCYAIFILYNMQTSYCISTASLMKYIGLLVYVTKSIRNVTIDKDTAKM